MHLGTCACTLSLVVLLRCLKQGKTKHGSEWQGVAVGVLKGWEDKVQLGKHWSKGLEKTDGLCYGKVL